jgi:WhiB family redox-sensing transcriptional regulator
MVGLQQGKEKNMAELSRLPLPIADHWEWQYKGACRELPAEMFFHPDGERGPRRRNRENAAKAVCATCAVLLGKEEPTIYEAS